MKSVRPEVGHAIRYKTIGACAHIHYPAWSQVQRRTWSRLLWSVVRP